MKFELAPLPYDYTALEPVIDARTMEIHHGKHHQAYVDKLNAALEDRAELAEKSLEELLSNLSAVPEDIRTTVQNNGGGHYNHARFWELMTPGGSQEPVGELGQAVKAAFGGFDEFKKTFSQAAMTRFGSGWGWLALKYGKLVVYSTPNQDSPIMKGDEDILGLDVWEHAYYLKYQNRRQEYIDAWWSVVNWDKANEFYLKSK